MLLVTTSFKARGRHAKVLTAGLVCLLALASCAPSGAQTPTTAPQGAIGPRAAAFLGPAPQAAPAKATASAKPATALKSPQATCPRPPKSFVRRAPGSGKTVALTFDDGPAPADREIAAILRNYGVHATFFLTGDHAASDPDTVRLLADDGHLIANHSYDHRYATEVASGWSVGYLTDQMARTSEVLSGITGKPVCYFRPPGGYTTNVLKTARQQGLTSVMWSLYSFDVDQPATTTDAGTAALIVNATKVGRQSHPVVLLHSGKASHEPDDIIGANRSNTVAALPAIIEWYRAKGYRFVKLDGTE